MEWYSRGHARRQTRWKEWDYTDFPDYAVHRMELQGSSQLILKTGPVDHTTILRDYARYESVRYARRWAMIRHIEEEQAL